MIIGGDRMAVIDNIKYNAENGLFYNKVETNDPVLTKEESETITSSYIRSRESVAYKCKAFVARQLANILTSALNRNTEIIGLEKLCDFYGGAFITSNHFSPTENTVIRLLAKKLGKKRINIVSQVSNFAMNGFIGFLMNYGDTIPLSDSLHYIKRDFPIVLAELLKRDELILIYPEQEMWFNYRKPRPPKRGAYHFAATLGVPVISCFVEMTDLETDDTDEFKNVKYTLHILDVLYPDKSKSVRENSEEMCMRDHALKKAAYEAAYGKPLDYTFEQSDIAGWKCGAE